MAESTKKKKQGRGQILIGNGVAGGLLGGIHYDFEGSQVIWQTSPLDYAAIHQFGGKAGRGRKVSITARPYMVFQDEDIEDFGQLVADFVMKGK